jgi:outer membrane protein assembly factor BamB
MTASPSRNWRVVPVALLAAVVLSGVPGWAGAATAAAGGIDPSAWLMRGYDPAHAGDNVGQRGLGPRVVRTLRLRGRYGFGNEVVSSPAVRDGVAFVNVYSSGIYSYVDALAVMGPGAPRLLWQATTIGYGCNISSPVIAGGLVYAGTGCIGGALFALRAATGQVAWRTPLAGAVGSSPVVANGVGYVASDDAAGHDGRIYAIDARTGTIRWAVRLGAAPGQSSPALSGGILFTGAQDGRLYAVNAATGKPRWTASTGGPLTGSPAVSSGMVFAGSQDGSVYAFDATSGQPRWVVKTGGPVVSSPAVHDGTVYIGSDDHGLYALAAATGARRWRAGLTAAITAGPALADGVVYAPVADGQVAAVRESNGAPVWLGTTAGVLVSSPVVADGMVLADAYGPSYLVGSLSVWAP